MAMNTEKVYLPNSDIKYWRKIELHAFSQISESGK